ncbi:hypothetical protein OH77DRAFT_1401645 [Trametes cingulata]|nr:hypothetical protein OH77DRAFT_1401645 [Trametes cingulata]
MHTIAYLRVLLAALPNSLPLVQPTQSKYKFHEFGLDEDDVEDMGLLGAVNRQLEVRLGPRTCKNDTFELKERGTGVEALADVLTRYLEEFPNNELLLKWLDDACRAAETVYSDAGQSVTEEAPRSIEAKGKTNAKTRKKPTARQKKKGAHSTSWKATNKRPDTKILTSYHDHRYRDVEELKDDRPGGSRVEPLLLLVSKPCFDLSKGDDPDCQDHKRVRCAASRKCNTTWKFPRAKQRILVHARSCGWLDIAWRNKARELVACQPEPEVSKLVATSSRRKHTSLDGNASDSDGTLDVASGSPRPKQVRLDPSQDGESGEARTTPRPPAGKPLTGFVEHGAKVLKEKGDLALTLFLVGCGVPPSVADSGFFKNFISVIQPKYNPASSTTIRDTLVPREAERVHMDLITQLRSTRNLTLSFDGGKLRRPRGIYTVTITTPSLRKSYLLDLNDTSRLDEFQEMIQNVKEIVTYMHHSTYTMEHYEDARKSLKIRTGLARIGTTRFWTYVSAAESVYNGLPAFRAIIANEELKIEIPGKNELFEKQSISTGMKFEVALLQYLAVTTPFARAIKCLESSATTASDVYAFWLAIMSRLEFLMTGSGAKKLGLSTQTMEDVRAIANQRFKELLEDGPEDIYIAAFFLDPRYRDAPILQTGNVNPLAIPPVHIRRAAATVSDPQEIAREKLVARVGRFLRGLLLREYGGKDMVDRGDILSLMELRNPLLASIPPVVAYERLKSELEAYAKPSAPFIKTLKPDQTVLGWWRKTQLDEDAHVLGALAIKIFSAVPNSMADERMMSIVTWLNSARRSGQHVQTVSDHVGIRQYYQNQVCIHSLPVSSAVGAVF